MSRKTLGIIGGIGPLSTMYFADMAIRLTDAKTDQEHIDMVIFNHASIPDRTSYIVGKSGDSPLPPMIGDARKLAELGVSYIAIPCNTAAYFYDEIQGAVDVPVINIISETVSYIKNCLENVKKVGILATRGTVFAGSYQSELRKNGLCCELPDENTQDKLMDIIYNQVKAGAAPDIRLFQDIIMRLRDKGCEAVILGCTELSVIRRDYRLFGREIVDSLEVLAYKSVTLCGKKINAQNCHLVNI